MIDKLLCWSLWVLCNDGYVAGVYLVADDDKRLSLAILLSIRSVLDDLQKKLLQQLQIGAGSYNAAKYPVYIHCKEATRQTMDVSRDLQITIEQRQTFSAAAAATELWHSRRHYQANDGWMSRGLDVLNTETWRQISVEKKIILGEFVCYRRLYLSIPIRRENGIVNII